MNETRPIVTIIINEDGTANVRMDNMSPLHMTYGAMLLLDKVYELLKEAGHAEMQEAVGSILQAVAALVQLAEVPEPKEVN